MIELQVGFITSLRPHFSILFSSIVHQNGRIKSIFFDAPATATNAELSWLSLTALLCELDGAPCARLPVLG